MNRGLILIGGGGHCKSVVDALPQSARETYDEIVLTDPALSEGSFVEGIRVAGSDDVLESLFEDGFQDAFITVGSIKDTTIRRKIHHKIKSVGINMINIVDKSAVVSETAMIGNGVFVGKGSVVNIDSVVEDGVIINTNATIEHECHVGAFSHISIGAILCGNVHVGTDVFIGPGAVITQGIVIGDRAIVGAGAVVLEDVPIGCTVVGIPARIVKQYNE